MEQFQQHMYCRTEAFQVDRLTGADLRTTCLAANASCGGMDFWTPTDFAMLSDEAFELLATLLNLIEGGRSWPVALLHAKAAMLANTEVFSFDSLVYRILMILSTLYRKLAATRLRHLQPLVT